MHFLRNPSLNKCLQENELLEEKARISNAIEFYQISLGSIAAKTAITN